MIKDDTASYVKNKGRLAYLFQGSEFYEKYAKEVNTYVAKYFEDGNFLDEIDACWQSGWDEIAQEEKIYGRAGILLRELIDCLNTRDEWYGSDFDEPYYLATEAAKEVEKLMKQKQTFR